MKKTMLGFSILIFGTLTSCKKDVSTGTPLSPLQQAVIQTESIAVEASPTTTGDSVYVINTTGQNGTKESIAFSALPSAATNYLTNNYAGYTAGAAFDTKDSTGTLNGYFAIFQFDSRPVGIKFDTTGTFTRILEQSEGRDLLTNDWHVGGLFDGRDGLQRDTISVAALPAAVQIYFTNNYPGDSLLNAFVSKSGDFFVTSQNSGLSISAFASDGTFINRLAPPQLPGSISQVSYTALPAPVSTFLSTAYPGYYFEDSYALNNSGIPTGFSLIIDADNTTYGMDFDVSGNFVNLKVIQ